MFKVMIGVRGWNTLWVRGRWESGLPNNSEQDENENLHSDLRECEQQIE